jgi:ATP-dependent DNA ligase
MTASKRDFTKFNEFPGALDAEGTGYHDLPTLWYKDDAERWRMWEIHIRLVKSDIELSGIDWDLLAESQVPIKESYYDVGSKVPAGHKAEVWVETGISGGKITRSAPTYIDSPVNEGKTNERNVFQQALIFARSQWLKRKEKGGNENKTEKKTSKLVNVMYFPMLARKFKDGEKHLVFPLYIQPKLDGVRCVVFLKKKDGGNKNVVAYTRTKKPFPSIEYIKNMLYPYLNALYDDEKNQSIYIDGELYKHGKKLQDISGDSRNEKADTESKDRNEYHIYDCFYPAELDNPFEERHKQLVEFNESLSDEAAEVLKVVPTYKITNMKAAEKMYAKFVKMGYEGAMLRNSQGPYLANAQKTGAFMRSKDLVKMKPKFTDEFECINYTEGKRGKDKGAVLWVCQTADGYEFNVTPKDITYEARYELFEECEKSFDKKYKGRMLTVEYEDLSKDGVPQRAKALTFRDYE